MASELAEKGLFTREATKAVILTFFGFLRADEPVRAAQYARDISYFASDWKQSGKREITVKDLPEFKPQRTWEEIQGHDDSPDHGDDWAQ